MFVQKVFFLIFNFFILIISGSYLYSLHEGITDIKQEISFLKKKGIATDNQEYLNVALKGTELDGKSGFLAQLNGLFSPDGFYHEGPYYTRYAILPFYMFANALQQTKPELKIFNYRNSILKKAY